MPATESVSLGFIADKRVKSAFLDSLWIYTMTRCQLHRARFALAASLFALGIALGAVVPSTSFAQESIRRDAPKDVVLGQMTVTLPPIIQMDGKDDRLSPGVRIHSIRNMLVLSASLAGSTVPVVYKRDTYRLVSEVWMLTPDEYAKLGGAGTDAQQFVALLVAIFGSRQ
jgi:hypothetical protein